jgi:hypothetical protein
MNLRVTLGRVKRAKFTPSRCSLYSSLLSWVFAYGCRKSLHRLFASFDDVNCTSPRVPLSGWPRGKAPTRPRGGDGGLHDDATRSVRPLARNRPTASSSVTPALPSLMLPFGSPLASPIDNAALDPLCFPTSPRTAVPRCPSKTTLHPPIWNNSRESCPLPAWRT